MERRTITYIKTNRLRKLKNLKLKSPNRLLDRKRRNFVHIAAKYGSAEVMMYLIDELSCDPWGNKDSKGNYPLHYAIKYCLKHYSRGNVKELVNNLLSSLPEGGDVLNQKNNKGTSLRQLLNALNIKSEVEDDKLVPPQSHVESSSNEEEEEWRDKLEYELHVESSEGWSSYREADDETFDQMADRIYKEYIQSKKSSRVPPKAPTPPPVLLEVLPRSDYERKERDFVSFDSQCHKIFNSTAMIGLMDIPFAVETPSAQILDVLFREGITKASVRKELIRWHPDKFFSKLKNRIKESEAEDVKRVIDHVSQSIIELGNR